MKFLFVLLPLLFSAPISWAQTPEVASSCHCFKNRVYNPDKKFAADKFLLATSFNSFIAVNFNLSKSQIVMMKMRGGINPDTLLIALYVAKEGGVNIDTVLAVRTHGGSWNSVFSLSNIKGSERAGKVFAAISETQEDETAAAEIVTNQLLRKYFALKDEEISFLREKGATDKESVLVNIIARCSSRESTPADIIIMHNRPDTSWGEIAAYYGFTPKEMGELLQK